MTKVAKRVGLADQMHQHVDAVRQLSANNNVAGYGGRRRRQGGERDGLTGPRTDESVVPIVLRRARPCVHMAGNNGVRARKRGNMKRFLTTTF